MLGLELNGALKNATTIIYRQCIFCSSSSWKSGSTTNAPTQMTLRWSCSHVLVYSLTLHKIEANVMKGGTITYLLREIRDKLVSWVTLSDK